MIKFGPSGAPDRFYSEGFKHAEQMAKWVKGAQKFVFQRFVDREGCIEKGLQAMDKATALRYVKIFAEEGINAVLRNYD